jgi:hypothetical protein
VHRYLIIYDRKLSDIIEIRDFDDSKAALSARLEAESTYSDRPEVEIVVLTARSQEALRGTHLRYFEKFGWMASQALSHGFFPAVDSNF